MANGLCIRGAACREYDTLKSAAAKAALSLEGHATAPAILVCRSDAVDYGDHPELAGYASGFPVKSDGTVDRSPPPAAPATQTAPLSVKVVV